QDGHQVRIGRHRPGDHRTDVGSLGAAGPVQDDAGAGPQAAAAGRAEALESIPEAVIGRRAGGAAGRADQRPLTSSSKRWSEAPAVDVSTPMRSAGTPSSAASAVFAAAAWASAV